MTIDITRLASVLVCLALATPFGSSLVLAQAAWLPPTVEDGVTQQLADRLAGLPMGSRPPLSAERRMASAKDAVSKLRATLEGWGVEGTLAKVPRFEGVAFPTSRDQLLDAMGRYQFCNLVLALQLAPNGQTDDFNQQFTGVLGLTAGTLAVLYLRQPFVAAGGTHEAIEAYLTSDDMEGIGARVQREPALLERAQAACTPVVVELVTKVIG